jgi:hypothetical protein
MSQVSNPASEDDAAAGIPEQNRELDLLYPFYLDVDMSMAFAAALTGGVALEEEQLDRASDTSRAVRNIRGNLNLWRVGGFGAGGEREAESGSTTESRLVLRHTEASIFIALHDELLHRKRLRREPAVEDISVTDLIEVEMGPAVAPLRRVVDQVIRLLDLVAPMLGIELADPVGTEPSVTAGKSGQRGNAKPAPKPVSDEARQFITLRRLVAALKDDLDRAGMIDIVVRRDDLPSVVLTLDKRFASDAALELLHTSKFTVVGKVNQIWRTEGDIVNLYRRSVLSLVPALAQGVAWNLFGLLGLAGRAIDVNSLQRSVSAALGIQPEPDGVSPSSENAPDAKGASAAAVSPEAPDVMFNEEAVGALLPVVPGPALQLLPLAICA